jgi:hypothetical protein
MTVHLPGPQVSQWSDGGPSVRSVGHGREAVQVSCETFMAALESRMPEVQLVTIQ